MTVLRCDVVGSTALGESVDPEALRSLLARYFARMKEIIEHHGGTVEKFIGDAVMAVFGVPRVHEDDALRACRAAIEMRDVLPALGVEGRIGLTTGEVVTGTEERLATGDAVNVAARLEQVANRGEVLIGEPTLLLVREAVDVEELEPLELKGKARPVTAYRLVSVHEPVGDRREMPFVGRERELAVIWTVLERTLADDCCELLTIVGEAGVGKSRLVAEALASVDTRSVAGRCLSYGEGITYWPVVEVIKQLDVLPADERAAYAINSLLGRSDSSAPAEEVAWGFRKLLEEAAPLVVVFDDIQWGEETFLDLLEHLALLSSGHPLLILALARPEFTERRPGWPLTLQLEPLPDESVNQLIGERMPVELRERIASAASGNPLFVSEMLAMAKQAPAAVGVPPTLQALLAARLDQLQPVERGVLEKAAVEGELFHRRAVQALSLESQVTPQLAALVRKGLIRTDAPQLTGEDAFRFRHVLIRDAAYAGLTKTARAGLHRRFADWLENRGADLVELEEIRGYHLEQAALYQAELGQPDAALAQRAGERLAASGRRALWRGDVHAAESLLERALEQLRPLRLDIPLELDLATAILDRPRAAAVAEAAAERARVENDVAGEAIARVVSARQRDFTDRGVEELEARARDALPLLEQAHDHDGLTRVWQALGDVADYYGRREQMAEAGLHALRHARSAGQRSGHLFGVDTALVFGPTPAGEALRTLDELLPDAPNPWPLLMRAELVAMLGRADEAAALAEGQAKRVQELLGHPMNADAVIAHVATLRADHETAERCLRRFCDALQDRHHTAGLSTHGPELGRSLCALGRYEEAEHWAQLGRELGDEHDVVTQALWRQVQALVHAHRGEQGEAEALARQAVAITERTDDLNMQGDALCDLAEALQAGDRTEAAAAALEQAFERYQRKQNLAMAERIETRLAELQQLLMPAERPKAPST